MSRATNRVLLPMDRVIAGAVLSLICFSVLMVYSASVSVAEVRYDDPLRIIRHWLFYIPVGLMIIWMLSRIDVTWWRAIAVPLLGIAVVMMIAVLIPGLGREINGAQRWFSLFGLTLQPVELLKPAVIIYMAYYMSVFPDRLCRFGSGLAPMLVVLIVSLALLLLQPDFGSAMLLSVVCFTMWFVGGVPIRHLAMLILSFVPVAVLVMIAEPYRVQRLTSFIDPWNDPLGSDYQLIQSMIAFGSGGLFGSGLGQGVQKLFYLPEVFTDFISASIGEELGLIGIVSMISVFAILLGRGVWLSMQTKEMFGRLLIIGCVVVLGTAVIINLGAAMGLLPTKGMPLPFVSYGGSALIGECVLVGLLLAVQRHLPGNKRIEKRSSDKAKRKTTRKRAKASPQAQAPAVEPGLEHLF